MTTIQPHFEKIRQVRFSPYLRGKGPRFTLTVWNTQSRIDGKNLLAYSLKRLREPTDTPAPKGASRTDRKSFTLFFGVDFCCSPMDAIDSDETIAALMGFLTLRPGDTDAEYFANYTREQLEYCEQHAETLACEVMSRFEEDPFV